MAVDTAALYQDYGPMVLRRCRRLLGDEQAALDAMQDTFVQVLRREDQLDGDAPSSLLWRVATNVCLNRLRSQRRRPEVPDGDLLLRIARSEDTEARTAAKSLLQRLFGAEPENSQTIAVLHLLDGMTHEEVAATVGLSVSGVRKRLRTLRGRLHALEATA
ncbi:MAG: sigma-70 family RNA polymerase sigma factor [Deltaproteobacteria bacterium]|nr:sigma-70 family RNA polymerase sigma factor [Deltaproteobacteria bacterium]